MALIDHLGITVADLESAVAQFDPVLTALGYTRHDADGSASWDHGTETELILFPEREQGSGPHRHGRVGWQHLAFDIHEPAEVDRLHAIALAAGWTSVRDPKLYPRFNDRYYAAFVEDDNGIRIEFAYNPPKTFAFAPEAITAHPEPDPGEDPWVDGPPSAEEIEIVPSDPRWPAWYQQTAGGIRTALGDRVLALAHVGSTSVPGLAAKPLIDIDLTVPDSADETSYVPALEALGYRLTVREPSFHEHRLLRLDDPAVNLHVWSPDSPEVVRHALFRDWLRAHPDDRALYVEAKLAAAPGGGGVTEYNRRKQDVIRAIYDRAFRGAGLLG